MTTNGSVLISTSTNYLLLLTWLFGAPYFGIPDVQGIVARGPRTNNSGSSCNWSGKLTANHRWSVHSSDLNEFVIDVSCHQCPHTHAPLFILPCVKTGYAEGSTGVDGSWGLVNTLDGALCLLVFTALAPGLVGLMLLGRSLDWKLYIILYLGVPFDTMWKDVLNKLKEG